MSIAVELCKALGFDPNKTERIEITIERTITRIKVVHLVEDGVDLFGGLRKVLKEYELKERA